MRAVHLAKRFFGALSPAAPSAEDEAWVRTVLLDGELALWRRMSAPDRRHAAGVARRVQAALGSDASRPVLAAALLHDVGKVASGLGTFGRVVATLAGTAANGDAPAAWSDRRGPVRRVGRYLRHGELGAGMLADAGSDGLTVTWAREHHLPEARWSLPPRLAHVLKAADDD